MGNKAQCMKSINQKSSVDLYCPVGQLLAI